MNVMASVTSPITYAQARRCMIHIVDSAEVAAQRQQTPYVRATAWKRKQEEPLRDAWDYLGIKG